MLSCEKTAYLVSEVRKKWKLSSVPSLSLSGEYQVRAGEVFCISCSKHQYDARSKVCTVQFGTL